MYELVSMYSATYLGFDSFHRGMDRIMADLGWFTESAGRVAVLHALSGRPLDRAELLETTGLSSSALAGVLNDLEARGWTCQRDGRYELTALGTFVAGNLDSFLDSVATERRFRGVIERLPTDIDGFSLDLLGEAVISRPDAGYPARPVERFAELVDESATMRALGTTTVESANIESVYRNVVDGTEVEVVYPRTVLETVFSTYPERAEEAVDTGDLSILVHENLPGGLVIFDDRVAIAGHDETDRLCVIVDTGDPDAYEWATSVYESYRREADPFYPVGFTD